MDGGRQGHSDLPGTGPRRLCAPSFPPNASADGEPHRGAWQAGGVSGWGCRWWLRAATRREGAPSAVPDPLAVEVARGGARRAPAALFLASRRCQCAVRRRWCAASRRPIAEPEGSIAAVIGERHGHSVRRRSSAPCRLGLSAFLAAMVLLRPVVVA